MKKFDALVVGELNVDLILNSIEAFPKIGTEILANEMTLTLGSSSAIFASNLSSLGLRVGFIGKLGKDVFGKLVLDSLTASGVDTSMIIQDDAVNTGATIVMSFGEERAMVTHMGAMESLSLEDIRPEMLSQARHLHLSSVFLQPGIKNDLENLFKMAKQEGLTTSFDPQWDPSEQWDLDLNSVFSYLDVFLPNESELMKLTGHENLDMAISALKGSKTTVVIKMGNKGSISLHEDKLLHIPPFLNKEVVDAIGAGDSFNAGFVAQFLRQASLDKCQEFGNLIGAISTTAPGGTGAFKVPENIMSIAKEKFGYDANKSTD